MKKVILIMTIIFSVFCMNDNIHANTYNGLNVRYEISKKGKKLKHKGYGEYYYKKDKHKRVNQKPAEDQKAYVKDYVGLRLSSAGYYSLGKEYLDTYGDETVQLICVDVDGRYIDISKEKELNKYVVIGQDFSPNSEITLRYSLKEDGTPDTEGFVESKSIEKITLYCKKMKKYNKKELIVPQEIPSPDKTQYSIRNYKGKNLATVGYYSLGKEYLDAYGSGYLSLVINTTDGSTVDISKLEQLCKYQIIDQDIVPGSKLTYTLDNMDLVTSQNYNSIALTVQPIQ